MIYIKIKHHISHVFCLFLICSVSLPLYTQDSAKVNFGYILLDPLVVTASRSNFEVNDFIALVQSDESFYQAFRKIRTLSYSADNELIFFNKKGKEKARYKSVTHQQSDGDCRSMETSSEQASGNYYKRRSRLRYYTAKLYDRLFFTHGEVCESRRVEQKGKPKGMSKHVAELKKLIFSPGEKANVPLIGNKTAIFSEKMAKYYDYRIDSRTYKDGTDCYVFSAVVKPKYLKRKKGKTVIKFLETYFDKSNFQVIARDYQLEYYGALFDFDIHIEIELKKLGDLYVPELMKYRGWWNVPTKKKEICHFTTRFYDYQIP